MDHYKTILVAVDLQPESDQITIKRAQAMAQDNNATLYVVHAIESINAYGAAYAYPTLVDVEAEISEEHTRQLVAEANIMGISESKLIIEQGPANVVIVQNAKRLNADLIIVGARSRHGLGLLLGSTTDSVLHNAPCDVLAIHLTH